MNCLFCVHRKRGLDRASHVVKFLQRADQHKLSKSRHGQGAQRLLQQHAVHPVHAVVRGRQVRPSQAHTHIQHRVSLRHYLLHNFALSVLSVSEFKHGYQTLFIQALLNAAFPPFLGCDRHAFCSGMTDVCAAGGVSRGPWLPGSASATDSVWARSRAARTTSSLRTKQR